jgi:chromosome segregation ATPase
LATSSWEKQYDVLYPDDLWKLDSVLKALAHRLEGTANPENYGEKEVAFADGEARPFLKKLDAAYTDVYNQLELVKGDRSKLEKRRAELESSLVRLQKDVEEYTKQVDRAKEREVEARRIKKRITEALEAHDHAVAGSTDRVAALGRRREELTAFLRRLDGQRAPFDEDNPPEAAIILAYPTE